VTQGLRVIALLVLPATAVFVAAAHAVTDVALFGASADGSTQVATALMGFAPGLIGYGGFLLATRAFYAAGNTRTPALVNAGMVVAASVGMAVIAAVVPDRRLVGALGLVHSVAYVGATVVLVAMLRHHVPFRIGPGFGRAAASALLGAALAGVAIAGVDSVVDGTGRAASLGMLVVAVAVGGALYAVVQRLAGGVRPAAFVDLLRSGPS
jgi:putative peptidoglycan lipid II flippase